MITYAFWKALLKPNSQIMYAAPTRTMVESFLLPHVREILATCPPELQPQYSKSTYTWTFPSGSTVRMSGTDKGNADYLRGTHSDLFICDEVGFMDEPEYLIKSVALPQTMTCGGRVVVVSTPPKSPSHPFKEMCYTAMNEGRYIFRDIYSATHVTPEIVEEFKKEVGGEKTTDWRREFLGQFVTDADSAILPEFQDNVQRIVQEWPTPTHFFPYVSTDFGFHDLTFSVFGYWDFVNQKLVIQDELVHQTSGSDVIAKDIMAKEQELWGRPPKLRIADCDPIIIQDLNVRHRLAFLKTRRDDLEAQVAALRALISEDRLIIDPKCKHIVEHLKNGIWDSSGRKFARSGKFGHFDGIAAMVYLVRNINRKSNPFPDPRYGNNYYVPGKQKKQSGFRSMFKPRHRR